MAKFIECTEMTVGNCITVNFDNVQTMENTEFGGKPGTKIVFVSGSYIHVEQGVKQLRDLANAT